LTCVHERERREAFERILEFVQGTGVTSLGFFGLIALLYTATRLLSNVEEALNASWQVPEGRGLLKQVTDYAAIVLFAPLCLLLAAGVGTMGQLATTLQTVQETIGIGGFLEWAASLLGPILVVGLAFTVLYMVMPNTSVSLRSALVGALIGALLWYLMLLLHVRFQLGVARYNALYSGFAAIPIFLVWVYVSWLVVLVGAHMAATHQRDRTLALHKRLGESDPERRELLGLTLVVRVARAFDRGCARPTLHQVTLDLGAQQSVMREVTHRMQAAGILVQVPIDGSLLLARAPERIRVKDVLDALRRHNGGFTREVPSEEDAHAALRALREIDSELSRSSHNMSLRDLLERE
jgi:membrane protein